MGNVPISCCRSKSPRLHHHGKSNHKGGAVNRHYSSGNRDGKQSSGYGGDDQESRHSPSHILQHISEREPDDSDTDPSSNPLNRPIFASRSSSTHKNRNSHYTDSYSSTNSRKQNTPITSSQDQGYNSNASTNLTQYEGNLNNSFENSIQYENSTDKCLNNSELFIPSDDNRNIHSNNPLLSSDRSTSSVPERDQTLSHPASRLQLVKCTENTSHNQASNLLKSSSCSTIFTDGSTISQPDLNQTIRCVSLAIYFHIKNRTSDSYDEIFDESIHPLKMPNNSDDNEQKQQSKENIMLNKDSSEESRIEEPDHAAIYLFVKTLFKAAQLTSEYAITTLVYLERLMTYAEMDLTPRTWRRMFLGAIVLSSKVWEDQAVWNVDYAQILEEISVEDINELERQFLELIQFNMNVPSSVYAKYYFHLRTLAFKHGFSREHALLTVGEAKTLEVSSKVHDYASF